MRPRGISDKKSGFHGAARHYHRSANSTEKNWEAWVNGVGGEKTRSKNWLKILGVITAILALLGLIVGLVIELA